MILLDTSIWIEFLSGRLSVSERAFEDFATCWPVVQEVLQGLRPGESRQFRERFQFLKRLSDPLPERLFVRAAELYRIGRQNGYTISPRDCLIAAIAIDNGVELWHRDRDFRAIAKYSELSLYAKG